MTWTDSEKDEITQIKTSIKDLEKDNAEDHKSIPMLEQMAWEHKEALKELRDSLTGGLKAEDKPGWLTQVRLNTQFREGFRKIYLTVIGSTVFVVLVAAWVTFKDVLINLYTNNGTPSGGPPTP